MAACTEQSVFRQVDLLMKLSLPPVTASLLLSAIAAVYCLNPAVAQTLDCTAPQSQLEMTMCAGQDYSKADAELNVAYAKARAVMKSYDADLPPGQRGAAKALLEAQRAWIPFRDAACKAEGYPFEGGTIQPMIVAECLARLTRRRTEDLRALAATN